MNDLDPIYIRHTIDALSTELFINNINKGKHQCMINRGAWQTVVHGSYACYVALMGSRQTRYILGIHQM